MSQIIHTPTACGRHPFVTTSDIVALQAAGGLSCTEKHTETMTHRFGVFFCERGCNMQKDISSDFHTTSPDTRGSPTCLRALTLLRP